MEVVVVLNNGAVYCDNLPRQNPEDAIKQIVQQHGYPLCAVYRAIVDGTELDILRWRR